MMSFSEGLVPVAMSQMSCLTQLAGSSADLLLRLWLRTRRAPAFKRSPAPTTAAAAGIPGPEAKITLVPRPLEAPVAVMISAPKMALAEPTERTATTAEKTVAGFILLV